MYGLYESGGYEILLARIRNFAEGLAFSDTDAVVFVVDDVVDVAVCVAVAAGDCVTTGVGVADGVPGFNAVGLGEAVGAGAVVGV